MKERNEESRLESIASMVHGALFAGHLLGAVYNLRKGRYVNALVHVSVATYDLISAMRHSRGETYLDMAKIREGL